MARDRNQQSDDCCNPASVDRVSQKSNISRQVSCLKHMLALGFLHSLNALQRLFSFKLMDAAQFASRMTKRQGVRAAWKRFSLKVHRTHLDRSS